MTTEATAASLTNVDVAVFALAELGGAERSVHLERIAARAYDLSPGRFRWDLDEYAEWIDKDKVRVSLVDARKQEKGALVKAVGVTKHGKSKQADLWRLSSDGVTWVLKNENRIRRALEGPAPRLKKGRATAVRKRITASPLYEEFLKEGTVSSNPYAFTDLLECSPDAAISVIETRFDELLAQVRLLEEPGLLEFLDACTLAHADMLRSE